MHVCVVPESFAGTTWNFPTSIAGMQTYKSYAKYSMPDILSNPIIVSSQFYGPNAMEYRDPTIRDNDTTAVTFTRTSSGWGAIVVAFTGVSANAGEEFSIEYIAHLECLPRVAQAAGQLPVQSTPSHSQPTIMAALTTVVPHTPTSFHEAEAKGLDVITAIGKAWSAGIGVAQSIAPIAEGAFDFLSGLFA